MRIEKPYRQRQTATIEVGADPDDVFALMCPVREYEWEPGWTTNLILSNSGLVEEGCIFTTPAGASIASSEKSNEALWVTPFYDTAKRKLTMIKFTPGECVTRIDIEVIADGGGAAVATTYEHTALSSAGRDIVDRHDKDSYAAIMAQWKTAIVNCLCGEQSVA